MSIYILDYKIPAWGEQPNADKTKLRLKRKKHFRKKSTKLLKSVQKKKKKTEKNVLHEKKKIENIVISFGRRKVRLKYKRT